MSSTRQIVRMLDRWAKQAKNPSEMVIYLEGEGFMGLADAAPLSDELPLADAAAGSAGTAGKASRDDHRHPAAPYDVRRYVEEFINTGSGAPILVLHNLGRRPIVQVIGGGSGWGDGGWGDDPWGGEFLSEVLTPVSIIHDSVDQITVTLAADDTGEVICIA